MLLLRTFSVGLLLAVLFIMGTANKFIQLMTGTSPVFAFQMAFLQKAPEAANLLGAGAIIPAAYILFCLGLGCFMAALFWPAIDSIICFVLRETDEFLDKLASKLFKKNKKAAILSGILLVAAAAGMTTQASAQEFVSVLPTQQMEFKAQPGAPGTPCFIVISEEIRAKAEK